MGGGGALHFELVFLGDIFGIFCYRPSNPPRAGFLPFLIGGEEGEGTWGFYAAGVAFSVGGGVGGMGKAVLLPAC